MDDATHLFRYRIDQQPLLPLTGYVGAVHVVDLGQGRSHVLWFASYELTHPAAAAAVASGLRGMLGAGIQGLTALAREAS